STAPSSSSSLLLFTEAMALSSGRLGLAVATMGHFAELAFAMQLGEAAGELVHEQPLFTAHFPVLYSYTHLTLPRNFADLPLI
ncbi:hypothetical protein Q2426_25795, partial [Escherichia coli]|nr:hypothetical protein [Escherichia coli]